MALDRNAAPILLAMAIGTAGCGGTSDPPVATDVVVSPAVDTITVTGGTIRFSAQVLDQRGSPMSGVPVDWSVQPSYVAGIDATELATALGSGVAQVRAYSEGVTGGGAPWRWC